MFYAVCLYPGSQPALCEGGVLEDHDEAQEFVGQFNRDAEAHCWRSRYEVRTDLTGVTVDEDVRSSIPPCLRDFLP